MVRGAACVVSRAKASGPARRCRAVSAAPCELDPRARSRRQSTFRLALSPRSGSRPGRRLSGRPHPSARHPGQPIPVRNSTYRPTPRGRHRRAAPPGFRLARQFGRPARGDPEAAWPETRPRRCSPAHACPQLSEPRRRSTWSGSMVGVSASLSSCSSAVVNSRRRARSAESSLLPERTVNSSSSPRPI